MKFKFCGNVACPEWFLTQIYMLNRLPSDHLQALLELLSDSFESKDGQRITQFLKRKGYDDRELDSLSSVLLFILKQSILSGTDSATLLRELSDLGTNHQSASMIAQQIPALLKHQLALRAQQCIQPAQHLLSFTPYRVIEGSVDVSYVEICNDGDSPSRMRLESGMARKLLAQLKRVSQQLEM